MAIRSHGKEERGASKFDLGRRETKKGGAAESEHERVLKTKREIQSKRGLAGERES